MNQIPKAQAARFLGQLVKDYAHQLREQGHSQAAELMTANGAASIQSLTTGESAQAVPDANDSD